MQEIIPRPHLICVTHPNAAVHRDLRSAGTGMSGFGSSRIIRERRDGALNRLPPSPCYDCFRDELVSSRTGSTVFPLRAILPVLWRTPNPAGYRDVQHRERLREAANESALARQTRPCHRWLEGYRPRHGAASRRGGVRPGARGARPGRVGRNRRCGAQPQPGRGGDGRRGPVAAGRDRAPRRQRHRGRAARRAGEQCRRHPARQLARGGRRCLAGPPGTSRCSASSASRARSTRG